MSNNNSGDVDDNNNFVDITSLINQYIDGNDGDSSSPHLDVTNPYLCNEETFSLHDSMAALEIIDPKLDCCEIPISVYKSDDRNTRNIKESDKDGDGDDSHEKKTESSSTRIKTVPPRPIETITLKTLPFWSSSNVSRDSPSSNPSPSCSYEDVKTILLENLIRIEAMLNGASVSESIFTCLYAHGHVLREIQNDLLSTFPNIKQQQQASNGNGNDNDAVNTSLTDKLASLLSFSSSSPSTTTATGTTTNSTQEHQSVQKLLLKKQTVYASVLGTVAISYIIHNIVFNADIYEEEDFSIHTYGLLDFFGSGGSGSNGRNSRSKNDNIIDDEQLTIHVLEYVILRLEEEEQQQQHDDTTNTRNNIEIMISILKYQLSLFHVCCLMSRLNAYNVRNVCSNVQSKLVPNCIEYLSTIQALLEAEEERQQNNQQEQDNGIEEKENANETITNKCYDSFVTRPLVGNAPIRKVNFNKPLTSILLLIDITNEIKWSVCDLLMTGNTLQRIRRKLISYSCSSNIINSNKKKKTPSKSSLSSSSSSSYSNSSSLADGLNILSRSLIVLNLYFDEKLLGQHVLGELIAQELFQLSGLPKSLSIYDDGTGVINNTDDKNDNSNSTTNNSPHPTATSCGKLFINRLAKPMYDTLKLVCLNKNRRRSYMDIIMFNDFSVLKQEATILDIHQFETSLFYKKYLTSSSQQQPNNSNTTPNDSTSSSNMLFYTNYVIYIITWMMEHYVSLGIELQLFYPTPADKYTDILIAYWYKEYLCSSLLNTIKIMKKNKQQIFLWKHNQQQQLQQQQKKAAANFSKAGSTAGKKGGGKKNRKKNHHSAAATATATTSSTQQSTAVVPAATVVEVEDNNDVYDDISDEEYQYDYMMISAKRFLCRGLVRFIASLAVIQKERGDEGSSTSKNDENDDDRQYEFTSYETKFNKRFESFFTKIQPEYSNNGEKSPTTTTSSLSPTLLTYEDYYEFQSNFNKVSSKDLLVASSDIFKSTKLMIDQLLTIVNNNNNKTNINSDNLEEGKLFMFAARDIELVKNLTKICVGNSVFIQKLTIQQKQKEKQQEGTKESSGDNSDNIANEEDGNVKVEFDFETNKEFCTIKIL